MNVGYESYARMLEMRVITQSWISYYRRKGRFAFRRLYERNNEQSEGTHTRLIGFEMTVHRGYGNRHRNENVEQDWVFRAYLDGTALYRRTRLRSMLNRCTVFDPIEQVVREYYNLDTTIQGVGENYQERYNTEMEFLRRKPLSPVLRNLAGQRNSLGEFLITKYNMREEVAV